MSSLAIIQQKNAAHLITDGAGYTPDGTLRVIGSKVIELPRAQSACVVRGAAYPIAVLPLLAAGMTSFDEVAAALPDLLSYIVGKYDKIAGDAASPLQRHFEVTMIGWSSNAGRPLAVVANTFAPNDPDDRTGVSQHEVYRQFMPLLVPAVACCPSVDFEAALGRPLETLDVEALDAERDGLEIIEAQRRTPMLFVDRGMYVIGGLAELTTATEQGISRRVLKRWPDRIGQPIVPEGAMPIEQAQQIHDEMMAAAA